MRSSPLLSSLGLALALGLAVCRTASAKDDLSSSKLGSIFDIPVKGDPPSPVKNMPEWDWTLQSCYDSNPQLDYACSQYFSDRCGGTADKLPYEHPALQSPEGSCASWTEKCIAIRYYCCWHPYQDWQNRKRQNPNIPPIQFNRNCPPWW